MAKRRRRRGGSARGRLPGPGAAFLARIIHRRSVEGAIGAGARAEPVFFRRTRSLGADNAAERLCERNPQP